MKISPIALATLVMILTLTGTLNFIAQQQDKNNIDVLAAQNEKLMKDISDLKQVASVLSNPVYSQIQTALLTTDLIGAETDRSKLTITELKAIDNVAYVAIDPVAGYDFDAASGYAKQVNGTWKFLTLGTGGDMTEFYNKENIPSELRK